MKRVLAVTDDPSVRTAIDAEIDGSFSVAHAATFDEALGLLPRASAVIIDVDTGRFYQDGIALMNEVHKHAPECGRILLAGAPRLFRALVAGRLSDRVLARKWPSGQLQTALRQVTDRTMVHRHDLDLGGPALASA